MTTLTRKAATIIATVALAGSSALVVAAPASAADPVIPTTPLTFEQPTITGLPAKIALPSGSTRKTVSFTVNVPGTPSDGSYTDVNLDGHEVWYQQSPSATVTVISSRVKPTSTPWVNRPTPITAGPLAFSLDISRYNTPGLYEVAIPIKQLAYVNRQFVDSTLVATARFALYANTKASLADTSVFAPSWRNGETAKITFRAPAYQKGAKVTLYVKKKGKKKYVKLTSAKLKASSYQSQAKLKGKNLRTGDKIYFKVATVKYAKGYKTKATKITKVYR